MNSCAHPRRDTQRTKLSPVGLLSRFAFGLCLTTLCTVTAASSPALAREPSPSAMRVVAYTTTGSIRFLGSTPGTPIARPAGLAAAASPARIARAFLARRASDFGIDSGTRNLSLRSARKASAGRSVVRFQQLHNGLPVFGGGLVVNLDRGGNVLSVNGDTLPTTDTSVMPRVTSSVARQTALAVTARARGVPVSRLRASEPRLWIYDSRLTGGPGLDRPTLVWRIEVSGHGRRPADELVLVDAQLGVVALHFDQIDEARQRLVCDANNTEAQVPCSVPVRVEGGPPSAIRDVDDAYELTGAAGDFYRRMFGRDSLDNGGMPLVSTTRYCPKGYECPWRNAAWIPDAQQMAFGQGFASADDVVGHELTHAVVDHTSNLFPYYQSGAIDESIADTLGELFDQTYGNGTDTAAARWLIGENAPGGPIRDMKHPTRFEQPDRMTSSYFTLDLRRADRGGIHTNSGVGNKAAFLITDGGTFNGRTVIGLGVEKAARIYYEVATNQLTPASDYGDLFYALPQACRNLVGTAGISAADCDQVVAAVNAVEMLDGLSYPRAADVCPGRGTLHDLFRDDLEDPARGNWTRQTRLGSNAWFYPQPAEGTYATSGHTNFWGWDQPDIADYSIAMTRDIAIPEAEAVYLHFKHAYSFANSGMRTFDGGVLEYSVDEGQTWNDAGFLLEKNGYDGVISPGLPEVVNPLGSVAAFVRDSKGYGSSRANLGPIAGKRVRFRFRIGTSGWSGDYGWFIDDVRIYTCSSHPPTATIGAPPTVAAGRFATWTISANDPAPDDQAGTFHYTIDWNGDGRADATVRHGRVLRLPHAYTHVGRYTVTVSAADHHGSVGRPARRTIVVRPPFEIASSSLALNRNGAVAVKVKALAANSRAATVTLRSASRIRIAKRSRFVLLGSAKQQLEAGKTTLVRVRLAAPERMLVERLETVSVRVTVAANGGHTARTLVLRAY